VAFSKLYIENRLPFVIHLVVDAKGGELAITAHRRAPSKTADRVEPGKAAVYKANGLLRSCMRGSKLNYVFQNKTGMQVIFTPGRSRLEDGPIFEIADGRN
jgi:hypothetical protein